MIDKKTINNSLKKVKFWDINEHKNQIHSKLYMIFLSAEIYSNNYIHIPLGSYWCLNYRCFWISFLSQTLVFIHKEVVDVAIWSFYVKGVVRILWLRVQTPCELYIYLCKTFIFLVSSREFPENRGCKCRVSRKPRVQMPPLHPR